MWWNIHGQRAERERQKELVIVSPLEIKAKSEPNISMFYHEKNVIFIDLLKKNVWYMMKTYFHTQSTHLLSL